jgi:hypothetical protein
MADKGGEDGREGCRGWQIGVARMGDDGGEDGG